MHNEVLEPTPQSSAASLKSIRVSRTQKPSQASPSCSPPRWPLPAASVLSVRAGDVVLGRFGKNAFWPALASEISNGATGVRLVFFGDHKELLLTTPTSIAERIRPFADLNNLSYKERPGDTDAYRTALEEANRWHAAADTTPTRWRATAARRRARAIGRLTGGRVVLAPSRRRAACPSGIVLASTDDAGRHLRVLLPWLAAPLVGGVMAAPRRRWLRTRTRKRMRTTMRAARRLHGATSRSRSSRQWVAAHPSVGAHEDEKGATRPPGLRAGSGAMPMLVMDGGSSCFASDDSGGSPRPSSSRSRNHRNYSDRGGPSSGSSSDSDKLIGRRVRVPALAFPSIVPSAAATTPYYDGKVMRISEGKRREVLEVYFSGDHTTCLFTKAQVRQWLLTDEGSKKKSKSGAALPNNPKKRPWQSQVDGSETQNQRDVQLAAEEGVHRSTIRRRRRRRSSWRRRELQEKAERQTTTRRERRMSPIRRP